MTRFSVIIPAYNAEATLGETLDSLIGQTFADWEAFVLDDASSDGTLALAQAYSASDNRIKTVRLEKCGPSRARNTAASKYARGEWVAFLDADDIWAPNKLERMAAELAVQDPPDALFARIAFFRGNPSEAKTFSKVPQAPLRPFDLLCENPVCTLSNLTVRRSAFLDAGGFDPSMVHGEDVEFMIRLAGDGRQIVGLDETLVYYRASDNGLSANLNAMRAGWQGALESLRRFEPAVGTCAVARAEAIHLRYLARRALRVRSQPFTALNLAARALWLSPSGFFSDPRRGALTMLAALARPLMPPAMCRLAFNR